MGPRRKVRRSKGRARGGDPVVDRPDDLAEPGEHRRLGEPLVDGLGDPDIVRALDRTRITCPVRRTAGAGTEGNRPPSEEPESLTGESCEAGGDS